MHAKTLVAGLMLATLALAVPSASAWTVHCTPNASAVCTAVDAADDLRRCDGDPGVHACLQANTPDGTCLLVTVGLQGAIACADTDPLGVLACTSVFITGIGHCPTDLLP